MYDQDFNCLNQRLVYNEKDTNKQFKAIFDVGHQRLNRVYIFCINSASMFFKFLKERVCSEKHFFSMYCLSPERRLSLKREVNTSLNFDTLLFILHI